MRFLFLPLLRCMALSCGVFALSAATTAAPEQNILLKSYAQKFDQYFLEKLEEKGIPGGAYAIIKGDEVIAMKGHGVRAKAGLFPVDEHTVFRLASLSKTFAASLTGKLIEENKFSWEDNISTYVPDFKFKNSHQAQTLKIRHILSHSSGIVPNAYDNLVEANVAFPKIISKFDKVKPICKPGDCYGYQNVIYSLIQPVIEQSTSESYADLMTEKILAPLGMKDSSLGLAPFIDHFNRASPHVRARGKWHTVKVKPGYYNLLPAAGVNASISDMSKWMIAQLGGNPDVLSDELLNNLTSKQIHTRGQTRRREWRKFITDAYYGLGWRIYQFGDDELIYHSGWVSGFRADIAFSKSYNIGLVILLNAESNVINEMSTTFWDEILNGPKPPPRLIAKKK
ncbi:serine hydrolase domain-containing protein [Paremcibacter congregatus]|uniref:serine hydrolase domain-containing protein n=1 Tax=Paremcibacter congregatus TaxID=2043170 RepID=UPI0030EE4CE0|tara:strand:- start:4408 stop:5598 length:1191 start_codon:yes stop_codon:yes gene_type:complete